MKVPFYKHNLNEEDIRELTETLQGTFLTTGPKTAQFEKDLANYLGVEASVGSTSWTNAAFLVLKAWGVGPGDEVIVPAMTFIATPNIVIHCGATPVFADVETETGNLDPVDVEKKVTPKTKAIIPVHLYGQMVDMRAFAELREKHGFKILEDSAHCIEGSREGYKPGQIGDAAAFSFYATKNITSGEGGAIATNDAELVEKLKGLRLHGMSKSAADRYTKKYEHWDMAEMGFKANMSDIQASLLLGQLKRIDELRARKEEICSYYEKRFLEKGIEFPCVLEDSVSARHLFTIWAPDGRRDEILLKLQEAGLGVAVNFRAVHLLSYYRKKYGCKPGDLPISEQIGDRTITIPMYPKMSDTEVEYVADSVIQAFQN